MPVQESWSKENIAKSISLSGDVSGSVSNVDLNKPVDISITVADDSHSHKFSGEGATITDIPSILTNIIDLNTTGFIVRTGSGTATTRSITVSGSGLSISNGDGVSGNPIITIATSSTGGSSGANKIPIADNNGKLDNSWIDTSTLSSGEKVKTFSIFGEIKENVDGLTNIRWYPSIDVNISKIFISCGVPNTGNNVTFYIYINGTLLTSIVMPTSQYTYSQDVSINLTTTDYLTIGITADNTSTLRNVTIQFKY